MLEFPYNAVNIKGVEVPDKTTHNHLCNECGTVITAFCTEDCTDEEEICDECKEKEKDG